MHLIRFALEDGTIAVGIRGDDETVRRLPFGSMAEALRIPLHDLRAIVEAPHPAVEGHVRLLAPVDGHTEVWGSGVTYRRSREARMEESQTADIYERVHDAERPELFFKSVSWRVVTDGEPIGVRADSAISVPEAELAVVANADGEAVGYTVCDDVTSRAIESASGAGSAIVPVSRIFFNMPICSRLSYRARVVFAARTGRCRPRKTSMWPASTPVRILRATARSSAMSCDTSA